MLKPPIRQSKKEKKRIIIVAIVLMIIIFGGGNALKIQKQFSVRNSEFSGVVTSYKYMGGRNGYYYYTDKGDCIMAFYFFNEDIPQNLNGADSIYKAPDSFRLYIYKKNNDGKYVFDRLAQIHDDSY